MPSTSTAGSNPKSSYSFKSKEGNKQLTKSFKLGFCEFREDVIQLR